MFLNSEAFRDRADDLAALLERELPGEFCRYPVRFAFPDGSLPRHWVHIEDLTSYFTAQLGVPPADELPVLTWLTVPTQVLRELTGGRVLHDGLGLLERYRALKWYPDDVWRYILACQWLRLSQEEPFVGRCGESVTSSARRSSPLGRSGN